MKSGEADDEIMIAEKSLQGSTSYIRYKVDKVPHDIKGGSFRMGGNGRVLVITILYVQRHSKTFDGFPITLVVKY